MKENEELMQRIASLEDHYWWYTGRREIIRSILGKLLKNSPLLLNLGSGTGSISCCAAEFAEVCNIDYSMAALTHSRLKTKANSIQADCLYLPIGNETIDMVLCLDVLEHVENEMEVLSEIRKVLKREGGYLLLTVPAFDWMWSSRDDFAGHFRRYTISSLSDVLEKGGFETVFSSYFNTLLFPLNLFDILADRIRRPRDNENFFPRTGDKVNWLLHKIFAMEKYFIPKPGLPFGRSLICLSRRSTG